MLARFGKEQKVQHSWHDYQRYWQESSVCNDLVARYGANLDRFDGVVFKGKADSRFCCERISTGRMDFACFSSRSGLKQRKDSDCSSKACAIKKAEPAITSSAFHLVKTDYSFSNITASAQVLGGLPAGAVIVTV